MAKMPLNGPGKAALPDDELSSTNSISYQDFGTAVSLRSSLDSSRSCCPSTRKESALHASRKLSQCNLGQNFSVEGYLDTIVMDFEGTERGGDGVAGPRGKEEDVEPGKAKGESDHMVKPAEVEVRDGGTSDMAAHLRLANGVPATLKMRPIPLEKRSHRDYIAKPRRGAGKRGAPFMTPPMGGNPSPGMFPPLQMRMMHPQQMQWLDGPVAFPAYRYRNEPTRRFSQMDAQLQQRGDPRPEQRRWSINFPPLEPKWRNRSGCKPTSQ